MNDSVGRVPSFSLRTSKKSYSFAGDMFACKIYLSSGGKPYLLGGRFSKTCAHCDMRSSQPYHYSSNENQLRVRQSQINGKKFEKNANEAEN